MNRNPYAPQPAIVADVPETRGPRPREVGLAVQLLWCQLVASILVAIDNVGWIRQLMATITMGFAGIPLQDQPRRVWQEIAMGYFFEDLWTEPVTLVILIRTAIVTALWAWVISRLAAGRNWARRTSMVLFALGLLSTVASIRVAREFPMFFLEPVVSAVLQAIAVYFLLKAPVRAWFKGGQTP